MRNILVILAAIMLASCHDPILGQDSSKAAKSLHSWTIKDATWRDVDPATLVPLSRSAVVTVEQVQDAVNEYNSETLDDFLRVYYGEAPDIAHAPLVTVYGAHPVTHAINWVAENITRQELVDNIDAWRRQSHGQVLYIDHVPPAPVIVYEKGPYERYAIYAIDAAGTIMYEDHCGYIEDDTWDGQWIIDGGWRDADHYYETRRQALWSEVVTHPGWRLIEHQLYTPPEVTP